VKLDALIKEAGKWEEVSDLNVHALSKPWPDGALNLSGR